MPFKSQETKAMENLIEKAMEELDRNPSIPGGLPTLLKMDQARKLPPRTGKGMLEQIIEFHYQTYENYINALKAGAFPGPAAEAVGLSSHTVMDWGIRGKKEHFAEQDTFYSRFYQDVRRAIAQRRVAIEQAVAQTSYQKWLSKGPGRIFGDEWSEGDGGAAKQIENKEAQDTTFVEEKEVQQIEHTTGVETRVIVLDQQTENETLDVLNEALRVRKEE